MPMLSQEENELITRVGPGTPMGNLMREYWLPALLSEEAKRDGDPVRIRLLGENLIAFRDSNSNVGLVADACPHRGASLFFGRNEECGLRCVYHGWKFDAAGNCVDMPNEPAESNFKHKVKAQAYPCLERGGVVWTYMGPRQTPPELPQLEANMVPDGQWQTSCFQRECNWLQALEGDIDTGHFNFLHAGHEDLSKQKPGTFSYYMLSQRAARYSVVDTDAGTMYGAYRDVDERQDYWRIAHFMMPVHALIPQSILGLRVAVRSWVPMDDEHTMAFNMSIIRTDASARQSPRPTLRDNSTDWYGRFRPVGNATNDYEIDREKQRTNESYTGIPTITMQDQAVTESMGAVYDRSREHLGTSDAMIIRTRRRLINAARAFADEGTTPPGVDHPEFYAQRSGGVLLPKGTNWVEATSELRKAFVEHPELDRTMGGPLVG